MANKSVLRVQVSLRRVVNFTEDQSAHDKPQSTEKTAVQAKSSKGQRLR